VKRPVLIAAAAIAGGCASSPPMHYYTLSQIPAASRLTATQGTLPVRLDRLTIPMELDRAQLVRRLDATRLLISEYDRWAAPLEDGIRRVLSDDLTSRLPPGRVADPNEPSIGEQRVSLAVDIRDFYGDAACAVTLRVAWVLKPPDSPSSLGNEEIHVPAATACTLATVPEAMSQALAQLSDRIATAIVRIQAPTGAAPHGPGH
jgi:uncharacterized protein